MARRESERVVNGLHKSLRSKWRDRLECWKPRNWRWIQNRQSAPKQKAEPELTTPSKHDNPAPTPSRVNTGISVTAHDIDAALNQNLGQGHLSSSSPSLDRLNQRSLREVLLEPAGADNKNAEMNDHSQEDRHDSTVPNDATRPQCLDFEEVQAEMNPTVIHSNGQADSEIPYSESPRQTPSRGSTVNIEPMHRQSMDPKSGNRGDRRARGSQGFTQGPHNSPSPSTTTKEVVVSLPEALSKLEPRELQDQVRRDSTSDSVVSSEDDPFILTMLVLARNDPEYKRTTPRRCRIDTGSKVSLTWRSTLRELGVEPYLFPIDKQFSGITPQKVTPIGIDHIKWLDGKQTPTDPNYMRLYSEDFYILEDIVDPDWVRPFDFLVGRKFCNINKYSLEHPKSTTAQFLALHVIEEFLIPHHAAVQALRGE